MAQAIPPINSTEYGLGGGLWPRDLQRAHRVAAALGSGLVDNTEAKSVWVKVDAQIPPWYQR